MSLHPEETVQKYLLSTPSRFVGAFEVDDLLITHAWPTRFGSSLRWEPGPASRSAFVVAFKTPPIERAVGAVVPDYSHVGEFVAAYLSVLFGKRFDRHGLIEGSGRFHMPDMTLFSSFCIPFRPHNSHDLRADYAIPLNLEEVRRLPLLYSGFNFEPSFNRTFDSSAKFYHQALETFDEDSEVAYLHLITAIEVLSSYFKFEASELVDHEVDAAFQSIRKGLPDGEKIVGQLSRKLLQIKKRFVKTVIRLIQPDFFEHSECPDLYGKLTPDLFDRRIAAAYDLRSKYVHAGESFGVAAGGYGNAEVLQQARSGNSPLGLAPTLTGMERIVRYCLLRFAQEHRAYIHPDTTEEPCNLSTSEGDSISIDVGSEAGARTDM